MIDFLSKEEVINSNRNIVFQEHLNSLKLYSVSVLADVQFGIDQRYDFSVYSQYLGHAGTLSFPSLCYRTSKPTGLLI